MRNEPSTPLWMPSLSGQESWTPGAGSSPLSIQPVSAELRPGRGVDQPWIAERRRPVQDHPGKPALHYETGRRQPSRAERAEVERCDSRPIAFGQVHLHRQARLLDQSAPAGTAAGLRLPGSRAPAVAATMAALPNQTYSSSKLPLVSKTQPASMTVRPATPSASTNFAP